MKCMLSIITLYLESNFFSKRKELSFAHQRNNTKTIIKLFLFDKTIKDIYLNTYLF